MKTSDNNLVPLFEPATDSPALSLSFQLPISVASFQFCLIDVEVALFSVEMDHPMCLYIQQQQQQLYLHSLETDEKITVKKTEC